MEKQRLSEKPLVHETAIVNDCQLGGWVSIGARTTMTETNFGDYSYVCNDCQIIYAEIGKFCSIASHVRINPGNHPLNKAALHHFTYRSVSYDLAETDDIAFFDWRRAHKVIIGHDAWIGHAAIVLPGVTIATGAAVGAGALVTKDVAAFTVVAGVPAKVIRRRVSEETEAALMRIQWWNWSREQLQETLGDFRTLDADEFVRKYGC
ncbi:chloramphenicol acetyltransferase [Dehalococcoidia bacterium]|nr:chloramphenicol acetyltransferase [Dehalococcoidia bacterium]